MPHTEVHPTKIGDRVRERLHAMHMSQTALAKKSGIDRSDINRIVNNHRPPRLTELPLLSAVLGVEVEDLLRNAEVPPDLAREMERANQSALRIVEAEAERDEAVARAEAVSAALGEAGIAFDRERERWAGELRSQQQECEERVRAAREDKARVEKALGEATAQVHRLRGAVAERDASLAALRKEVAGLQEKLTSEKSAKVLTGLISGLAGLAAGAAAVRLPQQDDDDLDDEFDEHED